MRTVLLTADTLEALESGFRVDLTCQGGKPVCVAGDLIDLDAFDDLHDGRQVQVTDTDGQPLLLSARA